MDFLLHRLVDGIISEKKLSQVGNNHWYQVAKPLLCWVMKGSDKGLTHHNGPLFSRDDNEAYCLLEVL